MTVLQLHLFIQTQMFAASRRYSQNIFIDLQRSRQRLHWRGFCSATKTSQRASVPDLLFEPLERGALPFPELLQPGKQAVVVGIDPDISGAIAVLSWQNPAADSSECSALLSSSSHRSSTLGTHAPSLASLSVEVHDLPVEVWQLGSRNKRQPNPVGIHQILQQCLEEPGLQSQHASRDEDGRQGTVARAVVEHTTPQHLSGKFAWYGMGFSFGLLTGILTAQGIPYRRVEASGWKRHMGLWRLGKDGSLALARQLFPQAGHLLRRKKDHGRAEALLIAAWGLGVRMQFLDPLPGWSDSGEEDTTTGRSAGRGEGSERGSSAVESPS